MVELLAVIVVLAIILIIAIPSIGGMLKDSAKKTFEVDAKEVLKAIDYKRIENPNFNPLTITKENIHEQIGIDSAQYSQIIIQLENKNTKIVIIGTNKWEGLIAYGTLKNINVVESKDYDELPPAITILGDNPASVSKGSTYTDAGATANDIEDGNVPISSTVIRNASNQIVATVDTSIFTTYTITYTAVDSKGNVTNAIRIVKVVDKTKPIITILGTNPTTINVNSIYNDAGATALDETDGDITSRIVVTGTVNPSIIGTYTITYNVNDNAGNAATPVTRTVNVIDVLAPVITILGPNPVSINLGGTYTDAGSTALDDVDGDVTSKIAVTGTVNPSVAGTYTITYTVKDNANNQAVATRTVYVLDNVPPTVTFSMNGNATYAKSRSTTVTVSDNVAINTSSLKYQWTISTVTPTEASFSTSFTNGGTINTPAGVTGSYFLWILGKDTSNNIMINRSNVFNLDNTAPVITLNDSNPVNIAMGSTYTDAGATATDAHSGVAGNVTATGTVNPNVAGTYTITYNVSDNVGNAATPVTRTVNVIQTIFTYGYTGASQTFTAPLTGKYQIELWGASGGGAPTGNGAYTKGTVTLAANTVMYVYIGGAGTIGLANGIAQASSTDNPPTFNGGGGGARGGTYNYTYRQGNSGGGASDVRLTSGTWNDTTSLRSRIMVAAGGGAKGTVTLAGEAGGLNGNVVNSYDHGGELYYSATGGTQTAGGARGYTNMGYYGNNGSFGIGANGGNYAVNHTYGAGGAGGGGGYYGGGSGASSEYNVGSSSSGGGSSFISGHAGCNAINSSGTATGQPNHYSGYVFTTTQMIDGAGYNWTTAKGSQVQMPNPSGGSYSLGVGNSGNGYAKITYIGS